MNSEPRRAAWGAEEQSRGVLSPWRLPERRAARTPQGRARAGARLGGGVGLQLHSRSVGLSLSFGRSGNRLSPSLSHPQPGVGGGGAGLGAEQDARQVERAAAAGPRVKPCAQLGMFWIWPRAGIFAKPW